MDFPLTWLLKDILAAFGNWPRWKELGKAPECIEALEQRVAELEKLLSRAPGNACPSCGAREFRVERTAPAGSFKEQRDGHRDVHMHCAACGFDDVIRRVPR